MQDNKIKENLNIPVDLSMFPSTRYYGSKRRLLSWIYDVTSNISFDSVFDRFGGTGSVSLLFQNMGKKVIYHDALNSNTLSAHALLSTKKLKENSITSFFKEIKKEQGFISNTFKDIYYSDDENQWLDGAVTKIHQLKDDKLKEHYWYCLFQACLKKRPFNMFHRANYYLRTADVKRKFGNLTTWNKSFISHIEEADKEMYQYSKQRPLGLRDADILSTENIKDQYVDADCIYLDPPYIGKNGCEDYFKRYHFLEGMIQYSDWDNLIDKTKLTKCINTPKYLKAWHNKEKFKELLFSEIKKYSSKIVVLSYQTEGYPNTDSIYDYFVENFSVVHIHNKPIAHALCKNVKTEVLIVGFPK